MKKKFVVLLFLIPGTAFALLQSRNEDPLTTLQTKITQGRATLEFEPEHGYLKSLLKNLDIPVSSQGLVFSKSRF